MSLTFRQSYRFNSEGVRVPCNHGHPEAVLKGSRVSGESYHCPVIDIDLPCTLTPSTTPGHYHLEIDAPMSWKRYRRLLKALVKAGIVEKGYYRASAMRKESFVRLPGVKRLPREYDDKPEVEVQEILEKLAAGGEKYWVGSDETDYNLAQAKVAAINAALKQRVAARRTSGRVVKW